MPGRIADCRRLFLVSALDLRIRRGNVREVGGSHRMDGEVIVGRIRTKPVHLVTVRRSDITRPDWQIQDWSPEHLAARSSGSLQPQSGGAPRSSTQEYRRARGGRRTDPADRLRRAGGGMTSWRFWRGHAGTRGPLTWRAFTSSSF